jgi:hypothetical protein
MTSGPKNARANHKKMRRWQAHGATETHGIATTHRRGVQAGKQMEET